MADTKISALPNGNPAQAGDVVPAVRSGTDFQLSVGSIAALAPAQVNADWNAVSGLAQILNKPTIPAAQVNADWNAVSGVAQILNKPVLAATLAVASHMWLASYSSTTGLFTQTQPAFTDISGTAVAAQYVTMAGDSGSGGTKGAVPAPGAGDAAASKFLKADGTWAVPAGSGTGLSSVGLSTTAAWLTVGSSPLTANGTLTINPTAGLTANQVLATPNGTTGALSTRSLVAADIPALPQSGITGLTAALALLAPLASPALTGVPTGTTATPGTNTTQLATTAFVTAAVGAASSGLSDPGGNGIVKRTALGTTAVALAADVNTTLGYTAANDALVAHLAGTETLTGAKTFSASPIVPTAGALDNTTKAASTAYADAAVGVEKTRALAAEALLAPLASPALTGNPTVPTQATSDNSTRAASTAYVTTAVAAVSNLLVPTTYSANATVATTVKYGQATAGSGGITLTVQSASLTVGQKQRFMKMDSAAGSVTLTDSGSATFNGQSTWVLVDQWQWAEIVWDGTQYTVFGN